MSKCQSGDSPESVLLKEEDIADRARRRSRRSCVDARRSLCSHQTRYIGALMYYSVFHQFRLVPRWLTVWGLVGITLTIIGAVLVMLHLIPGFGTVQMVLPLALAQAL
jgi:hypothetical protein